VSAIIGTNVFRAMAEEYKVPVAVAGFEYEHLVAALYDLLCQCREGTAAVHNLYPNAVTTAGNAEALALIDRYFMPRDTAWRGLGVIAGSGYTLRPEFFEFAAEDWEREGADVTEPSGCLCGSVIIGRATPPECPFFGDRCTPLDPVGPCMVSSEGACGIYFRNREHL